MPELPDVVLYIEHLNKRILGRKLEGVRISSLIRVDTMNKRSVPEIVVTHRIVDMPP